MLNIDIDKQQFINIFKQFDDLEKKQFFDFYQKDVYDYIVENDNIPKMTVAEYNQKLIESEQAYESGEFLSHNEVAKEIERWKSK